MSTSTFDIEEPLDAGHDPVPADLLEWFETAEWHEAVKRVERSHRLQARATIPMFVSRAAWGARDPAGTVSTNIKPVEMACHWEGPHMGVFPHTSCATKVRGIQAYHMDHNGWVDIAYSLIVCPHGFIFECRGVGRRTAANGTTSGNDRAYAVCFLGGKNDLFTNEAKHGFILAAQFLGVEHRPWYPHHHYFSTECCGPVITGYINQGHPDPTPTPGAPVMPGYEFRTSSTHGVDWPEVDGRGWVLFSDGSVFASPSANASPSNVRAVFGKSYWTAPTHHAGPDSARKLHIRMENGVYVNTIEDSEGKLFRDDGGAPFRTH